MLLALAITLLILLGAATPAGAIWLDNKHWVEDRYAISFCTNHAHVWSLMPEFGGRMYLGEISVKEARDWINRWYYLNST